MSNSISSTELEENLKASNNIYFFGREKAIADLKILVKQRTKIILIQGEGGVGKTVLSCQYLATQGFDVILDLWMAKETQNITNARSVVEEWLRRHFQDEPAREFGISLERLRIQLRKPNRKVGILIDNLEPALDGNGKFIPAHRDYVELLRVLADPSVHSLTLITSRERLGESAVNFQNYRLPGLDISAWEQFLLNQNLSVDSRCLNTMHQAYSGNAKAMRILSGTIQKDWHGDSNNFWQANENNLLIQGDLENLVVSQLNRLEQLDPQAYKLLCRLGCYRYQDVRSISLEGILSLLWDVPSEERIYVVKSLCDRSLIDFYKSEYWLHSVIRAEAIKRLRASEEWEFVNEKAAEFWSASVEIVDDIEDAFKALEAYHHYVAINEFELACQVILKARPTPLSSMGETESLNYAFDRFGLIQHIACTIATIIDKIENEYYLTILSGYLGRHYHHLGEIKKAIELYQISIEKGENYLRSHSQDGATDKLCLKVGQQNIISLLCQSTCKVILGETEAAIESYKQVESLAEATNYPLFLVFAWLSLAVIYSNNNFAEHDREKASALFAKADKLYGELPEAMLTTWSHVYSLYIAGIVYRNLGENEKSLEMFAQTLSYADKIQCIQPKAQAINGWAVLYRNLEDFQTAIAKHDEAIEMLAQIGAKSDLAEVYYEKGLTYQQMGDIENSRTNFEAAILAYAQIDAPKQVEKVRKVMDN
ncbi:ATP-binding protein [Aerosakkonema funiforme]|uniref:ATP-binding protein n=1 Tax=Aerosakkonema funiforme TaxID=1246630 RepID=UPI0035B73F57